jgi:hypothetical protein
LSALKPSLADVEYPLLRIQRFDVQDTDTRDSRYSIWFRLLWMVLFFALLFFAIKLLVAVICIGQLALVLINGEPNESLREFSIRMNRYSFHILQYLSFAEDRKPFPFSEFPDA